MFLENYFRKASLFWKDVLRSLPSSFIRCMPYISLTAKRFSLRSSLKSPALYLLEHSRLIRRFGALGPVLQLPLKQSAHSNWNQFTHKPQQTRVYQAPSCVLAGREQGQIWTRISQCWGRVASLSLWPWLVFTGLCWLWDPVVLLLQYFHFAC